MSRRRRRRTIERIIEMEITPMIDVVFLLIIFFMTTAQFARMTRADVELPREAGEQDEAPEEAGLVVNVMADGSIIVNGDPVSLDTLASLVRIEARAAGGAEHARVLLRADRSADTAHLNRIVTRLRELDIGAARVATEVPR